MRQFASIITTAAVLLLTACQGPTINSSNAATFVDAFMAGRITLLRDNPIALPSPWYVRRVYQLWRTGQWSYLARDVTENGYDVDLNWFLLGEAARGGGAFDAARVYYSKALNDAVSLDLTRRCSTFTDMCSGFVFPRDIEASIRR